MRNGNRIVTAAVLGAGAYLLWRWISGAMKSAGSQPALSYSQEIPNAALPGQPGYSWRYFTDGTTIDPQGRYWRDGAIVWSPPSTGASGSW